MKGEPMKGQTLSAKELEEPQASLSYVMITPARNEARLIEATIQSMIAQTILPLKWVIVSDGSTDGTDEIVERYAASHKWIELVRMPERKERHFAGKVHAFNAGYARVRDMDFDIIGSLDADLTFDQEYFSFLVDKFNRNASLGVAGTPFVEGESRYDYRFTSIEHVSGACQLFRRRCFEDIGGYVPIKRGGIDLVAVITARMKGWQTRTFPEKIISHHRKMGTGSGTKLAACFRFGKQDYYLGNHPLWEASRCLYQMTKRPLFLGGFLILSGYVWASLTRMERPISTELIKFRRAEQMTRLTQKLTFWKSRES
jgi:biofilm PGA synthesis N-glycosyltransferase PgaC